MCFLLYSDVDEYILDFAGIELKEKGEGKYDVYLYAENKILRIHSKQGYQDITYNTYEELRFTIITLGKKLYADTMIEKLDKAEYEITHNQFYLPLMTDGNEVSQLITNIRRIREDYAKYNFTLVIKLGRVDDSYINSVLNNNPTVKRSIDKAKEHAKELCYKSGEPNVTYWCYDYEPLVYATAYAIPEEKRIIVSFEVEDVGEVYRQVMGYNTAEEFFKVLGNFITNYC